MNVDQIAQKFKMFNAFSNHFKLINCCLRNMNATKNKPVHRRGLLCVASNWCEVLVRDIARDTARDTGDSSAE